MSTTTTTTEPDFDTIEAEAGTRLNELRDRQRTLALPALTDAKAQAELATVQREIGEAQAALETVGLARLQQQHLVEQAERERVEAARAKARGEARKLQTELAAAAHVFDVAAGKLVDALCAFASLRGELVQTMTRANARALNVPGSAPEAAMVFALHQANAPRGALEFAGVTARPQKLADSVPPLPFGGEES